MKRKGCMVRAAVAAAPSLDALLARNDLWRGSRLAGSAADGIATGFAALDAALPGAGWPKGALVEILAESPAQRRGGAAGCPGYGELSLLLPLLGQQTRAGGWIVLVAPPAKPHAPAWIAAGIDLSRVIVVAAGSHDRLWAIDRALRSRAAAAVLAWLPPVGASVLRRLQLAAEEGGTTFFAFRPGTCAGQSSPAPLRLAVGGAAGGAEIRLLKRRGPLLAAPLHLPVARPLRSFFPSSAEGAPAHALARPLASEPAAGRASLPTAA